MSGCVSDLQIHPQNYHNLLWLPCVFFLLTSLSSNNGNGSLNNIRGEMWENKATQGDVTLHHLSRAHMLLQVSIKSSQG